MSVVIPFRRPTPRPTSEAAAFRQRIELEIERLMELLDDLDGDPDEEPSLGWTKTMAWGNSQDLEEVGTEVGPTP